MGTAAAGCKAVRACWGAVGARAAARGCQKAHVPKPLHSFHITMSSV
eukprot:CAMPEP_0202376022 /NCGR_PEP_ID=MMETSP1127-20130417/6599_1 /ASSEMBLY_ACC=CAM_ASM_000462 /TAXON_ID=3047 /ORGANISM="Dunaliella tertiolecta, Strain CCMP1320" /LENGTH=46 /DNA_ID= /DNA_START= /DNA_END= /DNA_ORIENTATION=